MKTSTRVRMTSMLVAVATSFLAGCATTGTNDTMPRPLQLYAGTMEALAAKDWAKARPLVEELLRIDPEPGDHALLAAVLAGEGQQDGAFKELGIAIRTGAGEPGMSELGSSLRGDDIWQPLRADARFDALLAEYESTRWSPDALHFDIASSAAPRSTRCGGRGDAYLTEIRTKYALDGVLAGATDDLDRVRRITHWVHTQTGHTGWPEGQPTDPLGLLDAAAKGASFRCVEFGIAVAGSLQAVGIPARVVGSRARDVETRRLGAGHVFAEAWLADQHAWVFVDAQMDIVGLSKAGTPLNAIEFRNALANGTGASDYPAILAMCMYYFDYGTDARYPAALRDNVQVTVGPVGSSAPRYFQREPATLPDLFTHRPADVYGPPSERAPRS